MVRIVSNRERIKTVSWQIVHEWEEDFAEGLQSEMIFQCEEKKNLIEKIRYHHAFVKYIPLVKTGNTRIVFHMTAPYEFNWFSSPDYIPVIIDAWKQDLERIQQFCMYNKIVFLGSQEAVSELRKRNMENVHYLPVSISKRYKRTYVPDKDIDLIMFGRNHLVLNKWVDQLEKNTSLHVVRCRQDNTGDFCAWSNKTGFLGVINQRIELMNLIGRSHYTTVSSAGNDLENEFDLQRTGGYSPVTPRFFEAAVNYSVGIGIFPNNDDYNICNIKMASININTYEEFKDRISEKPDYNKVKSVFDLFLEQHWTEQRLAEIVRQAYAIFPEQDFLFNIINKK